MTSSAIPSRVSLLISILRLNQVLLTGFLPSSAAASVYLLMTAIRHRVSPEFIGSRNCVPMAFTVESPPAQGQKNLKAVPNECCLGRSPCVVCVFFPFILDIKFVGRTSQGRAGGRSHRTMDQLICAFLSHIIYELILTSRKRQ